MPTGRPSDGVSAPPATTLALYPFGAAGAPCPSDVLVRRSVIDAVGGFDEKFTGPLQMYEDQAFFARAYLATKMFFSSRTWLDYRLHAASCVAEVKRAGGYATVRGYFLDWFGAYIEPRKVPGKEAVRRAIGKARWRLAHPVVARIERRLLRLFS